MNFHTLFLGACYGAGILGGLLLLAGSFTARARLAPRWIRVALLMSGPLAFAWGALGFELVFTSATLSRHAYALVLHYKVLLGGMALGILILLVASGEFIRAFSGPRK